jgi:probable phosphoglycerate mutase
MPRGARRAPTIVVLVRHGKTSTTGVLLPGRRPGLHLDDEGRRQADAAAQRLAKLPRIDAVYSSPLERARETAAPIARARGLSVRTERGLLEIDVGAWAGLKLDRARKKPEWAIVQRHATGFRFPDGESFLEMQTRVVGTLADLVARHPGRTIVAVSHADPIKAAVAHALGVHLDLFQRITIGTASITVVAYGDGTPRVLTVNAIDGDLAGLVPR